VQHLLSRVHTLNVQSLTGLSCAVNLRIQNWVELLMFPLTRIRSGGAVEHIASFGLDPETYGDIKVADDTARSVSLNDD
jgi:hypothetical protein